MRKAHVFPLTANTAVNCECTPESGGWEQFDLLEPSLLIILAKNKLQHTKASFEHVELFTNMTGLQLTFRQRDVPCSPNSSSHLQPDGTCGQPLRASESKHSALIQAS